MPRLHRFLKVRDGFSLVEVLIVMALIALAAVVVGPWFVKLSQRNQIKSAAREIQSTLLAARMKAVKRNLPVTVVISSPSGTQPIVFDTIEPPPPAPTPTRIPGRLELPARAAQFVVTPFAGTITFGADGRLGPTPPAPTPAVIVIEGPLGATNMNQITIQANSSGRIEVITPTVWK